MDTKGRADGQVRYRVSELPPNHFDLLGDDALGAQVSRAALAPVPWKPDVAPSVTERLAREAMAYPEQYTPGAQAPVANTPTSSAASIPGRT